MLPGFDAAPLKRDFKKLVTRALSLTPFSQTLLDDATGAEARSTLGAAASGANSDITSLSGLTTALSIAQGGTGGLNANAARANLLQLPPVRQTVLSGPVDSSGHASFGGSTGSETLTASGTIVATAANGVSGDRIGSIDNPAFTSPAGNGTGYLYLDINTDGTCDEGVSSALPDYHWGGTYSTTAGQFTFNIQEMTGKVGNGSTAAQTYRVYIGECPHTSGAWSGTIVWYSLMGRYDSDYTTGLPVSGTQVSKNHNLGLIPYEAEVILKCTTADADYSVNDVLMHACTSTATSGQWSKAQVVLGRLAATFANSGAAWVAFNKSSGTAFSMTTANWAYRLVVRRGW